MFLEDESFRFIGGNRLPEEMQGSFLYSKDISLDEWREETRQYIRQHLSYSPSVVPLGERIVERVEFEKYFREKVYFDSAAGCSIPAYLLIPKHVKLPAPAMIALHDHGGMFYWGKEKAVEYSGDKPVLKDYIDGGYDGVPLAVGLAEQGYVVLAIDSLFFGERRWKLETDTGSFRDRLEPFVLESEQYVKEYNRIESEIESELVRSIFYKGHTFMGIRMWDDIASIDYLCSRPEADTSRIGCIGLSMGGHRSGWLSAMDDRIRCAVIVGMTFRHEEMIRRRIENLAWMWAVPQIDQTLDYPDIVSLSAPKPLLIQHGKKDNLFPDQTGQKAMEQIRQVYRKAGAEEHFQTEIYDVGHEFNSKMRESAFYWLDKNL